MKGHRPRFCGLDAGKRSSRSEFVKRTAFSRHRNSRLDDESRTELKGEPILQKMLADFDAKYL